MPSSNRAFWEGKISGNIARDRRVTRQLRKQGWAVLRIRECALSRARLAGTIARLKRALGQQCDMPLLRRHGRERKIIRAGRLMQWSD
jgi:G:T-mismatch repair DNA endonuclease (very short patch repair protein)